MNAIDTAVIINNEVANDVEVKATLGELFHAVCSFTFSGAKAALAWVWNTIKSIYTAVCEFTAPKVVASRNWLSAKLAVAAEKTAAKPTLVAVAAA